MSLLENLSWRYAAKKYDPTRQVAAADLDKILEAARLAPSSYGLQPYRVVVISNPAVKEQLVPVAWNQRMVADCSHLLVFAAWDDYDAPRVHQIFNATTDQRGTPRGTAFGSHTEGIVASQVALSADAAFIDAAKQACISFGLAMAQAAELGIDNTPMGGFDPDALDELLGLRAQGLKSVYLLALGYRQPEGDWLVSLNKARTPREEFVITIA